MEKILLQSIEPVMVKEELECLKSVRSEVLKNQRSAPDGKLIVSNCRNTVQYYFGAKSAGKPRRYLSKKKEMKMIRQLAQKKYDFLFLKKLNRQIAVLERFLKGYKPENLEKVHEGLSKSIKPLAEDYCSRKDAYILSWQNRNSRNGIFCPEGLRYDTSFGLKVRSKSEVMIAEALHAKKIPFRYEEPIKLKGHGIVHPDFLCLNRRTLKEVVWEHFGLMDEAEYADNAVEKIKHYQQNGFVQGKNFFCTLETKKHPLDMKQIMHDIDSYLA